MKLTIQETQLILNVLDVASQRGAFRGAGDAEHRHTAQATG